ncbi:MAG: DUF5018 domain-containing protein [Bacteroidales bacterium]|jgi:hypothetical protein|nr:DUF5018 domain-containing protein [Bacteroidales bacterium]
MKKNLLFTVLAFMFATVFSSYGQYTGTGTFTKITTVDQIESGAYYVLFGVNGTSKGALKNTLSGGRFASEGVEPDGSDQFVNPAASIVWKLTKDGDGNVTVYNEDAKKYCEIFKSSTSGFAFESVSTQQFIPSADAGVFKLKSNGAASSGRCISIYKTDWRPYSESSAKDLYLYKYVPAVDNDAPTAAFNLTEGKSNVAETQQFVVTFSEAVRKADGTEITNANVADIITLTEIPPVNPQVEKTDLIITISDDKKIVTIDTKTILKTAPMPVYNYKLTVSGVEDLAGNDMAADAVLNFSTRNAPNDPSGDNFFWSDDYEVDHVAKTIKGIPFGVTKADFLAKLSFRGTPGKHLVNGPAFVTDDNAVLVNGNLLALNDGLVGPTPPVPGATIYTLNIPSPVTIKSIQETANLSGTSDKIGEKVWIQGVVTAIEKNSDDSQKAYFIQDAAAAWSGIYIKDTKAVAVGNKVSIKGTVGAYKNMTHIESVTESTVVEANATPFAPVDITIQDANKEDYESVLVKMTGRAKTEIASKKWTITDGVNDLFVYGKMYYPATVTTNDTYTVTGIHGQYNSDYQLYPRAEADYIVKSSANSVATFVIQHNEGDAVIDNITRTIKAKVVHGTNVTALTAAYTLSKNATIAPDPVNATDYTNPVEFTVTAENGDDIKWTVTVEVAPAVSEENDIKTFTITNIKGDAVIDAYAKTVKAKVTNGTALDNLTATITVSAKANITPDPATVTDYTNPVVFKVTAESGAAQDWTVKITETPVPPTGTLFMSEIADPKDKYEGRFIELYNGGADIDFDAEDYYLVKLTNGDSKKVTEIKLTGTLASYETYIVALKAQSDFEKFYPGRKVDLVTSKVVNGNGDDPYILVKGGAFGTGTIIDIYGTYEDGTGKPWEYADGKAVRKSTIKTGNVAWVADEWTITRPANVADMDPEVHTVDGIQDLKAPKVSFDVAEGAENIVLDTDIKIFFNEAILNEDGTEVTDANVASLIFLKQSDNGNDIAFTATINAEKTEITVNPDADLAPFTNYKLRMGSVEDAAGNESDAVMLNFKSKVAETAEALIKTFSIPNMLGEATIDTENKVIKALVFEGTDITNVDATVTMSTGATVDPAFTGINFTNPVQFQVTSQENHPGTGAKVVNTWTVTVEVEDVLTIKEIQEVPVSGDESALKGQIVSTKGIVTSLVNNKDGNLQGYMIQDAAEAWSGIYVHDNTHADVKVGDQLHIRGKVDEFFKATQVRDLVYYKVLAQGQTVYSPIELTTSDASQEKYESVLVKVTGDCTVAPNNYKEWKIEDTSGVELVINSKTYTPDHKVGRKYQVIGYMTYAFNKFQVIVRAAADVVDVTPPNTEANITAVTVPGIVGDANIDNSAKTVKATVAHGTDVTNLAITYTLSYGATIAPDPTTVTDYSSAVNFKVTAEDGKASADWTVTITIAPKKSTEAMITAATVPSIVGEVAIDNSAKTIKANVTKGTDLTNLAVTYTVSDKATISPDPATVKDYSAPVKFTVTAEDGTTSVEWTVTIVEDKATTVGEESFKFELYPNPVKPGETLFIDTDVTSSAKVEIFTAIGTHVQTVIVNDGTLNTSLRSGIYILRVTIDNKVKTVRLIVE